MGNNSMPRELPKSFELSYRIAIDNIQSIKKQEWVFTSSGLTVYAALVLASEKIEFSECARLLLVIALAGSLLFAIIIFGGLWWSLEQSRKDIAFIQEHPSYKHQFRKPTNRIFFFDSGAIFVGLFFILMCGASLAAYAIYHSHLPSCGS
jgi:4-hydroxybenzoate polyprenyltransferase